ncbi:MAG: FAD-dependent oxidoreductase [Deltaproteobacteria bacterium]|nr:FAD-dependent oxidoreductase [Deltaproteobacteria bacterium]
MSQGSSIVPVVIVGGGFAGAAMAYHLLQRAPSELPIVLVERGPRVGRGVAFSAEHPLLRLNVPASRMSLDPAKPDDFVTWAGVPSTPNVFLPRARYAAYVQERLQQASRDRPLSVVRGDAIDVRDHAVHLADGRRIEGSAVVLATGLGAPSRPAALVGARVIDAWDEAEVAAIPSAARVLLVGSGLTALDALVLLRSRGHAGEVTMLSRRGLLPRPHLEPWRPASPLPESVLAAAPATLRGLLRWGRTWVREAGVPWQLAVDALRPHLPRFWRSLSPADRVRFVRRVRPFWEVLRHRAPSELLALTDSGLRRLQGRLVRARDGEAAVDVELQLRDGVHRERFDAVVVCTGPALERLDEVQPLVRALVSSGTAVRDPAGLGLETDEGGALLEPSGQPSSWLFGLGAMRRASRWETTSVPEIASHARALAERLLAARGVR